MNKTELYDFIAQQELGVVGSVSLDGVPQAELVGIAVSPELEMIFDTVKTSRKFKNLTANLWCSFVIGWTGEITLPYEGGARQPEGSVLAQYQQIYFTRWPDGPARLTWPGITYLAVRPKWIRYSDYD